MVTAFLSKLNTIGASVRRTAGSLNADQSGQTFAPVADWYAQLESYYTNEAYDLLSASGSYKARYGLYRQIRSVYNPTRRAVDWYPGHVYPGAWTADGLPLPNGVACCIPFASDTPEDLRIAAVTLLGWGNWRSERYAYVRTGAMLGDAFAELEVSMERGKVYPRLLHPKYISDISWNAAGDVVSYMVEIPQVDEVSGRAYLWGKEVTKDTVCTYRDGRPASYDEQPAEQTNPFGFVPAVWVQHRNIGGQHGACAIDGVLGKIDELNHIVSSAHDYIGKFQAQGAVLATSASVKDLESIGANGATASMSNPAAGKQEIRYIKGPADLTIHRLIENLGLGEAKPYVESLIAEIENDLPETVMDEQLRQMTQVTGPGAARLMGDVANKLDEAQGNYDGGLVKLIQMGVAMMGELLRSGAFGLGSRLSDAQRLFAPFDLSSYDAGDLDLTLIPRPLIPDTPMERVQGAAARELIKTVAGLQESGYSLEDIFGEGRVPTVVPGLLDQREAASSTTASLIGRAFNAGVQ